MLNKDLRRRVFAILESSDKTSTLGKRVDFALIVLIIVNIFSVILETIDSIYLAYAVYFDVIEFVSVIIFSIEYLLRLWVCVENEEDKTTRLPRLKYAASPLAIIDLIAILPFYLSFIFAFDLRFLRVLRLLRIFKLTRYSSAMTMLLDVLREESSSFFAGFFILLVLLILAASGAYLVEHDTQPDKFGSIPAAMWWAVATLTTVGYGDVTPITAWGKLFGACVTIIGIGMAALPAGILASGLADHLRRRREVLSLEFRSALEDGIIDKDEEEELEALRKKLGLSHHVVGEILEGLKIEQESAHANFCPHCGGAIPRLYLNPGSQEQEG